MNIILPIDRQTVPRHPIALPVSQFYSHVDVVGSNATIADILQEIQAIPRSEALRWLCSLSQAILAEGGMSAGTQIQWARDLFPPDWCRKLEAMMQNDGIDAGKIFHRRTVWFVLQLVVMSCRNAAIDMPNDEVAKRLGRACFMASDVLNDIESEFESNLSEDDEVEWMVAVFVQMQDSSYVRVDFDLLGRARLLWEEAAQNVEFHAELAKRSVPRLEEAFHNAHGISLAEFLRFLTAVYGRFFGQQLRANLNPLLFDLANDEVAKAFAEDVREKAISLISQTPEQLAIRLLRTRQSWAFDVTPIRERPLIEVLPGKYCCPDLTLLVRTFIDRVFFLLQDAYGKDVFRSLMGKLFECYVHRLFGECTVTTGAGRTYAASPRFEGTHDEAGDGILAWSNTAAVMECKAGLLTTRQRLSGIPREIFQGIETISAKKSGTRRKGVGQLARNIARLTSDDSKVVCQGQLLDLAACRKIYPVLVCFEEALGIHAVQKWLQPQFDAEYAKAGGAVDRVGPLMVLTVRDVEALTTAARFVSIENVLNRYAQHLVSQPKDYTGSFHRFLRYEFGAKVQWKESLTCLKHREMLEECVPHTSSPTQDE